MCCLKDTCVSFLYVEQQIAAQGQGAIPAVLCYRKRFGGVNQVQLVQLWCAVSGLLKIAAFHECLVVKSWSSSVQVILFP